MRVVDQVVEDLADRLLVGQDQASRRRALPGSKASARLLASARSRCDFDARLEHRGQAQRPVLEEFLARFEPGQAEHVEDQLVEPVGLLVDPLQESDVDRFVVQGPVEQGLGVGLDRGQRVFSSWEALATKSCRIRSSRRRSVTSWKTSTAPAAGEPGRGVP